MCKQIVAKGHIKGKNHDYEVAKCTFKTDQSIHDEHIVDVNLEINTRVNNVDLMNFSMELNDLLNKYKAKENENGKN